MDEKDFQDLLNEIDSMSIEEYNQFHEEALKMKNSGLSIKIPEEECIVPSDQDFELAITGTFTVTDTFTIDSQFAAFYMTATESQTCNGDKIWPEAA